MRKLSHCKFNITTWNKGGDMWVKFRQSLNDFWLWFDESENHIAVKEFKVIPSTPFNSCFSLGGPAIKGSFSYYHVANFNS